MTDLMIPEQGGALAPGDDSVSGLVRLAIEQKVPVEVLERLVALQERVTERNARGAFFEALSKFQDECPEVRKAKEAKITSKRTGGEFRYTYAPLEEITRTIRPALRRNGLSYSWNVREGDKSLIVTCTLRHIDGHEEHADFPVPLEPAERMSESQRNGAALTYGKRQSLTSVLGLTTADADTDAARVAARTEFITDNQAADLMSMADEVGANREKFLKYLGVTDASEVLMADYGKAIKALEEKRRA